VLLAVRGRQFGRGAIRRQKTLDVYWMDSEAGGSTLIVTPATSPC